RATRAAAESLVTVDSVWIKNAKVEDGKLTFELDTNDIAANRIGHINIRGRGIDLELEVAQTPFAFDVATGTLGHYAGSEATVSIPAELDGVPVLSIGKENVDLQNDFGGDDDVAKAALPFYRNTTITKVILPEGLKKIGGFAFAGSTVEKVIFPESMDKIGAYAFAGSSLESLTLPADLTYIGLDVLRNCTTIKTITFLGDKPQFAAHSGQDEDPSATPAPSNYTDIFFSTVNLEHIYADIQKYPAWTNTIFTKQGGSLSIEQMP
ncbi:MAG: leucine-rich repeat domain-containing protein, partial [Tannerella sp.]|nr:leucine-rich repeat domain-containing protein [Tannerella sp.]